MRLTVGPLPAAVYWRRRGVVLVALAMVVLVVSYACGGPSTSNAVGQNPPTHFPTGTSSGPRPTTTSAHPVATTVPPPTAFSLVTGTAQPTAAGVNAGSGACADDEIELTASAQSSQAQRGDPVDVTIKIKNTSSRTCSRDVGADAQELRLQEAAEIVWSSDDCNPRHSTDIRSFGPGQAASFTLTWNGSRSRTGAGAVNCTAGPPDAAAYDLIPRLDHKVGPAFALRVGAAS
jgi:hypothetical protein